MKKIKRNFKNIVYYFTSLRISTIYKLVGILLLIGILLWVFQTMNKSENSEKKQNIVIAGIVVNKGQNYIIVKDTSNTKYLISDIKDENYEIGSEVNVSIATIIEQGSEKKPTTIISSNIKITKENTKNKKADSGILNYIKETEEYFANLNTLEETKIRFITIIDFLFYNGKIKDYTLDDLTNQTKFQIFQMALSIDKKVENQFPGYKETLSNTEKIYTGIKNKIIEQYLILAADICHYDANLCALSKKEFQEMKEVFSISWNVIRNLLTNSTEDLKEWYEIYSGKEQ